MVSLGSRRRIVNPTRLELARHLRGWNRSDLASALGVSSSAISQIEGGSFEPSRELIANAAIALKVKPEYFYLSFDNPLEGEPFFRARRNSRKSEMLRARAYAQSVAEIATKFESWLEFPELRIGQIWRADATTDMSTIELVAGHARSILGIPEGPVPSMVRLLESSGAVVVAVPDFDDAIDAFSVRSRARPIVVLCSAAGAMARRRFDAAHELAHLTIHDSPATANRTQEQQAHRFASAFLMPAGEIEPWLPRVAGDFALLEHASKTWGVSIQALTYRARTLGTLSETAFRETMRSLSAHGWRTREPVDLGLAERPVLLARAVETLQSVPLSPSEIAQSLGLTSGRLMRMIREPDDDSESADAPLISLDTARSAIRMG